MIYEVLFVGGALGFLLMALAGFHHGGGHHGGHHAGGHHGHHAQGHHAGARWHQQHGQQSHGAKRVMFIPSPMDLFSLALGAGAAGLLAKEAGDSTRAYIAVGGAILFAFFLVRPIFSFMGKFVSTPTEGLEGIISLPAEAITAFDSHGKGIVRLTLNGEIVQLLASLDHSERDRGLDVKKGDEVIVTSVNSKAGTCQVTRELSG